MKLRHRLELTLSGTMALVLLGSFSVAAVMIERDENSDLDDTLEHEAHYAAARGVVEDGRSDVHEDARLTRRMGAIYAVPSGRVLSATRSFGGAVPAWATLGITLPISGVGHFADLQVGGVKTRAVVLPLDGDRALLVALSRHAIDEDLHFTRWLFAALFVGATGATWLVARRLGKRLVLDVEAIAATARRVAVGDLAARVPPIAGTDELVRLATDLDHMIDRLDEAMRSQRTFVSHAAHELRSPLTTLRGELQLTLRRRRSNEEYRAAIVDTLVDVEHLVGLAEDLLTLARVEHEPSAEVALVREVVEDALRMARGEAEARDVKLEWDGGAADGLKVPGRRPAVARALRNLVDNAVAHSPVGGRVRVEVVLADGQVQIAVTDEGEGIAADDAAQIFTPFYRGSRDQSRPGAGLGLAIARELARRSGGNVTLDERTTSGRFVLALPASSRAGQ